ncbi:MAG TPA: teichoic acid glycosylation protein [Ruminococcaceae bacterium]|jgi:putative flippase GtrA|nr:teichoic acid glycosylation protein [Oscillospiraceae bacterium]HCM23963.1 teichoic acid glycosylation protein [Oscillospiraceae bacterium]
MMKEKLQAAWKYLTSKEMILYIVFGIITTLLNLVVYFLLTDAVKMNKPLAYFIAWAVGVTIAFITNKKYVFESKVKKKKGILFELGTFIGGRLLTFGIGEVLITAFVVMLHQSNLWWKLITNVIEIVGNWLVSKYITFKKKTDQEPAMEEEVK